MESAALVKVFPDEVIAKAYSDVLGKAALQVGALLEESAKTFRLFTIPLQLMATWQDRFSRWLEDIRNAVPAERHVEAPGYIAGPVFQVLQFAPDASHLKKLYSNLLKRAIDRERQNEAHPAFVMIIAQLAPDEALILSLIEPAGLSFRVRVDLLAPIAESMLPTDAALIASALYPVPPESIRGTSFIAPIHLELVDPHQYQLYVEHLEHLNLIRLDRCPVAYESNNAGSFIIYKVVAVLTTFGLLFKTVCIDD